MLQFASHPLSYIANFHAIYVQTSLYLEKNICDCTATGLEVYASVMSCGGVNNGVGCQRVNRSCETVNLSITCL